MVCYGEFNSAPQLKVYRMLTFGGKELYWAVRCRFNFRDPLNQEENIAGSMYDPKYGPEHG